MSARLCRHQIAAPRARGSRYAATSGGALGWLCGLKLASARRQRRMGRFEAGRGILGVEGRCPYGAGWARCPWARPDRAARAVARA